MALAPLPARFSEIFGDLPDRRVAGRCDYTLLSLLFMALCAVLSGCKGWDEMAEFAGTKRAWFETFFALPGKMPCGCTFRRLFERLRAKELSERLPLWLSAFATSLAGCDVAVDGKAVKGACDPARPTAPLYLLHVWACDARLLLGQLVVPGAPGELAGTAAMLKLLDLAGSRVTLDANGCTQANAQAIVEAGANYLFGLKGNRGPIYEETKALFAQVRTTSSTPFLESTDHDKGHGRVEQRTIRVLDAELLPQARRAKWRSLRSLLEVERTRIVGGKTTTEVHYYLSSEERDPLEHLTSVRAHWGIENQLHWVLDVSMGEDECRVRDRNAAENLALLRRMALQLMTRPEAGKQSVVMKMRKAGWSDDYRLKLLGLASTQ